MKIKFGTAGIGPVKDIEKTFEKFKKLGIKAAEIPFTYGIFIKKKEDIKKVKTASENFGIELSIHTPYWMNLNSEDLKIVEASKKRVLDCCKIGHEIGAKNIVFHCGYFMKKSKSETYENIRDRIKEMQKEIEKKKWVVKLCPETMGKINVFGSVKEISQLVKDTECGFCIDFAHVLARDKSVNWENLKKLFPAKNWHCHFSGIEHGDKGEKHHKKTEAKYWKWLLKNLPKEKNFTIINESPTPFEDAIEGIEIWKEMKI